MSAQGHSVYPLLPVIYDVAYKKGIRPERPMAISSVASQMGITASPIAAAAAVVMATAVDNHLNIGLIDVLVVTIPATFVGLMAACTWSLKRGKDLDKDLEFKERCKDPEFMKELEDDAALEGNQSIEKSAKNRTDHFCPWDRCRHLCCHVW
ncbi:anaerobic C4-dicarboxylate transporter family protein [Vibrio sp. PP-XX7]